MRKSVLVTAVVIFAATAAAGAAWPDIELVEVAGGFDDPVHLNHAGDGSGRLFVVEQAGVIRLVDGGVPLEEPFLDISDRVSCCGERGLLSVAFPPGYSTTGSFYVNYTDGGGATVVSRFLLDNDPNRADPASERQLLVIGQPFANHNGGQIAFGPDGFLYIGTGDGGSAGDPLNSGQEPLSLLGKMLRIDVESGEQPYAIPDSNPFAFSGSHLPEIWALGLRNPWRFSFDRATGDLYIADVGQNRYEEVHHQPAASEGGENYGWRILEGSHCFNPNPCDPEGLELPVFEYEHSLGCSITGGHVSRYAHSPRLAGIYLFGDYCSGRIWGLRQEGGDWQSELLADTALAISSFGEDEAGRIYVLDRRTGSVFAIAVPGPVDNPLLSSQLE
jgi:glucose/arabinose dehydrogenase